MQRRLQQRRHGVDSAMASHIAEKEHRLQEADLKQRYSKHQTLFNKIFALFERREQQVITCLTSDYEE